MGRINKSSIDKVYSAADMAEVIGDFMELKKTGASYTGLSPITDERTPSFKVSPSKGVWKCFSSGTGGKDAISFLTKVQGMSYREAIEYVANKYSIILESEDGSFRRSEINEPIIHTPKKPIIYSSHSMDLVIQHGNGFRGNNFIQFLKKYFPVKTIQDVILYYNLGTSTHVPGATLFWYLDRNKIPRYGKIIQYDPNTGSSKNTSGKVLKISSISYELKLGKTFIKRPTLFGEHLINNGNKYYGIVESEKTAVIMTMIDDRMTWLATGGTSKLSLELLSPLSGKNIILFPDAQGKNNEAFEKWNKVAIKGKAIGLDISCSNVLNSIYGNTNSGYDLADHYLRGVDKKPVKETKTVKAEEEVVLSSYEIKYNKLLSKNKTLNTLMDSFDLETQDGNKPRILNSA